MNAKGEEEFEIAKATNDIDVQVDSNREMISKEKYDKLLEELNKKKNVILLKENCDGLNSYTIDVSEYEGYQNFTKENFFLRLKQTTFKTSSPVDQGINIKYEDGKITISENHYRTNGYVFYAQYDVYLIY